MVASIGKIASPSQGVSYYEKDGYYAKDDPAHREASAWAGKGAEALGLSFADCQPSNEMSPKNPPSQEPERGSVPHAVTPRFSISRSLICGACLK